MFLWQTCSPVSWIQQLFVHMFFDELCLHWYIKKDLQREHWSALFTSTVKRLKQQSFRAAEVWAVVESVMRYYLLAWHDIMRCSLPAKTHRGEVSGEELFLCLQQELFCFQSGMNGCEALCPAQTKLTWKYRVRGERGRISLEMQSRRGSVVFKICMKPIIKATALTNQAFKYN